MSGANLAIRAKQKERATRYGKQERDLWHKRRVRKLSKTAKLVLVFLISAPVGRGTSLPGVVHGRAVVLADDIGLKLAEFNKALAELVEAGLVDLSNDDGDLVIVVLGAWFDEDADAVLMNAPVSISQAVAWKNAIKDLPACDAKSRLVASMRRYLDFLPDEPSDAGADTIPSVIRGALGEADGRLPPGSPPATGPQGLGLGLGHGPTQGHGRSHPQGPPVPERERASASSDRHPVAERILLAFAERERTAGVRRHVVEALANGYKPAEILPVALWLKSDDCELEKRTAWNALHSDRISMNVENAADWVEGCNPDFAAKVRDWVDWHVHFIGVIEGASGRSPRFEDEMVAEADRPLGDDGMPDMEEINRSPGETASWPDVWEWRTGVRCPSDDDEDRNEIYDLAERLGGERRHAEQLLEEFCEKHANVSSPWPAWDRAWDVAVYTMMGYPSDCYAQASYRGDIVGDGDGDVEADEGERMHFITAGAEQDLVVAAQVCSWEFHRLPRPMPWREWDRHIRACNQERPDELEPETSWAEMVLVSSAEPAHRRLAVLREMIADAARERAVGLAGLGARLGVSAERARDCKTAADVFLAAGYPADAMIRCKDVEGGAERELYVCSRKDLAVVLGDLPLGGADMDVFRRLTAPMPWRQWLDERTEITYRSRAAALATARPSPPAPAQLPLAAAVAAAEADVVLAELERKPTSRATSADLRIAAIEAGLGDIAPRQQGAA